MNRDEGRPSLKRLRVGGRQGDELPSDGSSTSSSATSAGRASALWSLSASWWESPQHPGRPARFSRQVKCVLAVSFVHGAG